MLSETHF